MMAVVLTDDEHAWTSLVSTPGTVAARGDAQSAVFYAVSDALTAARCALTGCVSARFAVTAGEIDWPSDSTGGRWLVDADRALTKAEPGQIVVTAAVRLLASQSESFQPIDDGCFILDQRPSAGQTAVPTPPPPLPPSLGGAQRHSLVGRDDCLDVLNEAWKASAIGPGQIVLIGGEAGAGKTRLASELARQVAAEGGAVLYGGCHADLATPYQPWVHATDRLLATLPAGALSTDLIAAAAPLAGLLPRVERIVGRHRRVTADADAERAKVHGAFAALLDEARSRWPTLVVLDDLHWATAQTLAVLNHLAGEGLPHGLMIVGTFRDTGDEVTEPLAGCLADLRRVHAVLRLRLAALDASDVECFVVDAVGRKLDSGLRELAARLSERTGGNAFYLCELWRSVGTDRHLLTTVPDSVREVVAARVGGLSATARTVTELAAVCGEAVDGRVLRAACTLSPDEIEAGIDELIDAGVLFAQGPSGDVRFVHAIVRDAVEARIARRARKALHRDVAIAVETVFAADRRPVLADLARHFAAAGGPIERVAHYGRQAAALAFGATAYEEAIAHLEAVLALRPAPLETAEVLVELGAAQLRAGLFTATRESCTKAFALASDLLAVDCAGRAAVLHEDAVHFPGLPGELAIPMLRAALQMLGEDPSAVRTRVLASLGRALAFSGDNRNGVAIGETAVNEARAAGDDASLIVALQGLSVSIDEPERVLAITSELKALADRIGDPWGSSYASGNTMRSLIALGRLGDARQALARHVTANNSRFATFRYMGYAFDVVVSLAAGDFAAAEAAAELAAGFGATHDSPYDAGVYGLQMFAIRRAQGRLAEVAPMMRVVATTDAAPLWRPGLAVVYADLGMLDEAGEVFAVLSPDRFAAVPRDALWPACLAFLAETCLALGDKEQAAVLYDELLSFRRRNLMAAMTICFGPADRLLGGLAGLLGRPADAHFADAVALAGASESPLWLAEARIDWAGARLAVGDQAGAEPLVNEAVDVARRMGFGRVLAVAERISSGAHQQSQAVNLPAGLSGREVEVLGLVAAGLSNREIGERLFISQNTAANHIRTILRKTGCHNRAEAASYATRHGLANPPYPRFT